VEAEGCWSGMTEGRANEEQFKEDESIPCTLIIPARESY